MPARPGPNALARTRNGDGSRGNLVPRGWTGDPHAHDGAVACSPVLTVVARGWRGAEFAGAERYLRREGVRRRGLRPVLAPAVDFERATAAALFAP
ncbi:hypothetical protein ACQP1O_21860 [Nocardia sp. CA-151230]|uniref:hypothetical protein n=1 Tax=Nocardia sp. CA-151230 TaxID=3239982 RepID=UPI003D9450BB